MAGLRSLAGRRVHGGLGGMVPVTDGAPEHGLVLDVAECLRNIVWFRTTDSRHFGWEGPASPAAVPAFLDGKQDGLSRNHSREHGSGSRCNFSSCWCWNGKVYRGVDIAARGAVKGCRYQVAQGGERNALCHNFDSKRCLMRHRDEAPAGTVATFLSTVVSGGSRAARATRRLDWRERNVTMTNRGARPYRPVRFPCRLQILPSGTNRQLRCRTILRGVGQTTTTSRLLGNTWRPRASMAFARCPSTEPRSMTST